MMALLHHVAVDIFRSENTAKCDLIKVIIFPKDINLEYSRLCLDLFIAEILVLTNYGKEDKPHHVLESKDPFWSPQRLSLRQEFVTAKHEHISQYLAE